MTRNIHEHFVNARKSVHRDVVHRFSECLGHDGAAGERSGVGGSLAAPAAGNQVNSGMNDTHHSITTPFR